MTAAPCGIATADRLNRRQPGRSQGRAASGRTGKRRDCGVRRFCKKQFLKRKSASCRLASRLLFTPMASEASLARGRQSKLPHTMQYILCRRYCIRFLHRPGAADRDARPCLAQHFCDLSGYQSFARQTSPWRPCRTLKPSPRGSGTGGAPRQTAIRVRQGAAGFADNCRWLRASREQGRCSCCGRFLVRLRGRPRRPGCCLLGFLKLLKEFSMERCVMDVGPVSTRHGDRPPLSGAWREGRPRTGVACRHSSDQSILEGGLTATAVAAGRVFGKSAATMAVPWPRRMALTKSTFMVTFSHGKTKADVWPGLFPGEIAWKPIPCATRTEPKWFVT